MSQAIMLIDESDTFLELMEEVLEDAGYTTHADAQMTTTHTKILQPLPQLVIVNAMFGHEEHGIALVEDLKLDPVTTDIPLLLCSEPLPAIIALTEHLAALRIWFLAKPFTAAQLLDRIQSIFSANAG